MGELLRGTGLTQSSTMVRIVQPDLEPENKTKSGTSRTSSATANIVGRSFLLITPGENLTSVFGGDWPFRCYDSKKRFLRPFNANLVIDKVMAIKRNDDDFSVDPPLSAIGRGTSQMVGYALWKANQRERFGVQHWFSAPELACLQTLSEVYRGFGNNTDCSPGLLIIEKLCDWYGKSSIPRFVNMESMAVRASTKADDRIVAESNLRINWRFYTQMNRKKRIWDIRRYQSQTNFETETFDDYSDRVISGFNNILKGVSRYSKIKREKKEKSIHGRHRSETSRDPPRTDSSGPLSVVCVPPATFVQLTAFALRGVLTLREAELTDYRKEIVYHSTCQMKCNGTPKWELAQPYVLPPEYSPLRPFNLGEFTKTRYS